MTRAQYTEARQAIRLNAHLRSIRYDDSKRHDRTRVYRCTMDAADTWLKRVDLVTRRNFVHNLTETLSRDTRVVITSARYVDQDTKRNYTWLSREYFNGYTDSGVYELWCPIVSDSACHHPASSGYMLIRGGTPGRAQWWHAMTRKTLRAWRPHV